MDVFAFHIHPDLSDYFVSGIDRSFPPESGLDEFVDYDFADSLLKGIPHFLELGPQYFVSNTLFFVGLVTTAITRNERYHQFYAISFWSRQW